MELNWQDQEEEGAKERETSQMTVKILSLCYIGRLVKTAKSIWEIALEEQATNKFNFGFVVFEWILGQPQRNDRQTI